MISMDKKYRTRDGREVRIYAVDGCNGHRIHGAIYDGKAHGWQHRAWFPDGRMYGGYSCSDYDLIEVKPRIKREVWVNVYRDHQEAYSNLEAAQRSARIHRIACVKTVIDCEEGEGL